MKSAKPNPALSGDQRERLLVRVLQGLLAGRRFASHADVAEALKTRCAELRIAYDAGLVSAAIARLEQGGRQPIVGRPGPPPADVDDEHTSITKAEAIDAWQRIRDHFDKGTP